MTIYITRIVVIFIHLAIHLVMMTIAMLVANWSGLKAAPYWIGALIAAEICKGIRVRDQAN